MSKAVGWRGWGSGIVSSCVYWSLFHVTPEPALPLKRWLWAMMFLHWVGLNPTCKSGFNAFKITIRSFNTWNAVSSLLMKYIWITCKYMKSIQGVGVCLVFVLSVFCDDMVTALAEGGSALSSASVFTAYRERVWGWTSFKQQITLRMALPCALQLPQLINRPHRGVYLLFRERPFHF